MDLQAVYKANFHHEVKKIVRNNTKQDVIQVKVKTYLMQNVPKALLHQA